MQIFVAIFVFNMITILPFFISGAEIGFIIFILVMVFGADKIPEIARGLGKGMRMIRNASEDIKGEIIKSADKQGIDTRKITQDVQGEIDKVKDDIEEISGSIKRKF